MPRLAGKTGLITGAGTGIGRAIALAMAREGAAVALAARRRELLEGVAREIAAAGGTAMAVECDVTVRASVETALAAAEARFGLVNVIVNNAGAAVVANAEKTSDEDWRRILDVNLTGTFMVSRAALDFLRRAGGGAIVNIGSVLGLVARKDRAAYCAAKGGVTLLTKAMALDHAHEKIRRELHLPFDRGNAARGGIAGERGRRFGGSAADPRAGNSAGAIGSAGRCGGISSLFGLG